MIKSTKYFHLLLFTKKLKITSISEIFFRSNTSQVYEFCAFVKNFQKFTNFSKICHRLVCKLVCFELSQQNNKISILFYYLKHILLAIPPGFYMLNVFCIGGIKFILIFFKFWKRIKWVIETIICHLSVIKSLA